METDFDQRLALLRSRYLDSLPSKHSHLLEAWAAFREAPGDESARANLRTLLHRLAGSAPAYGYAALGEVAATASHRLSVDDLRDLSVDEVAEQVERLLPMIEAITRSKPADPGPATERATPLRVILVEDDLDQAAAIAGILSLQGFSVRHAEHSESFWEVVTTWPCDAVVIDYWLGAETARDVVALVRNEPTFSSIALLCLTVETNEAKLKAVIDAGCDAVLQKHEAPQRLVETLHTHVNARRASR